jgi:hypothetical protein
VNFSTQVHDFDPGINPYPSGLFWTMQVADNAVTANPAAGRASLAVENAAMFDFFSIPNALFRFMQPASVPAHASFDLIWTGPVSDRKSISDKATGFEGEFVATSATMGWSAQTDAFSFVSDPAATSHSVAAVLGTERNGRFFRGT